MTVINRINKLLNESGDAITGPGESSLHTDEVGKFWVVTRPIIYKGEDKHNSTLNDICFKSTILGLANQVRGGLSDRGQIYGFYKEESKAKEIAKKLLTSDKDEDIYHDHRR